MSGVFDTQINRVLGIISEYFATSTNVDRNLALAISVGSIYKVYPGLIKVGKFNDFMQKIRKSGSLIYDRLEDVYVEPIGYEEIRETLEQYRCVFIIGSPEYGKTYTATKLLWEFYKNGIEPMYIEKESKETADACVLRKLEYQDNSLKNTIIYIEDPVGKIEYKSNKHFEESIRSITSGLGVINAYLIITMSDE